MINDPLIHGKQPLQNIVSIEIQDNKAVIFQETAQGIITTEVPNKFWILAPRPLERDWRRLQGDLYYKYGKQYPTREAFLEARKRFRRADIYSIYDPKEAFMVNYGYTYFKGMKVEDVSVLAFDIETTTLEHNKDSKVLLISNTFRNKGNIVRKLFSYTDYKTEKEFLDAWCDWVREQDPSILVTYNGTSFDIPYLDFIAKKNDTELRLGRDGSNIVFNDYESKFRKDGSQSYSYRKFNVFGRSHVDVFFLSIKYDIGRKYSNYKLKSIIKEEGLEKEDRQFYDASQIRFKYKDPIEWLKIQKYCENDSDDSLALYDLMIDASFYLTQSVPKSFQLMIESATGSQMNSILVRSYLQNGHSIPKADNVEKFAGGISHGLPGNYKCVFSLDFSSLYPSVMLQHNLFPRYKDPNNNFLNMVRYFRDERLKNKQLAKETNDKYYSGLEQSQKVGINSVYGLLGAQGLNFNDSFQASEVTRYSRYYLTSSIEYFTGKNFDVWKKENNLIDEEHE